jgi:hypothetical protein
LYAPRVVEFLRENVFPHEQHYLCFNYCNIFAFGAYSNTPVEGTNRGIKYGDNPVQPNMSRGQSTKVLSNQDEARGQAKSRSIADAFNKTPVWTDMESSRNLMIRSESMFQRELKGAESYISLQVHPFKWFILRSAPRMISQDAILPVFERIHTVTVDENDGRMYCDCGDGCCNGIPDRHMAHVARKYGIQNNADEPLFGYCDVSIRQWISYSKFLLADPVTLNGPERDIRSC